MATDWRGKARRLTRQLEEAAELETRYLSQAVSLQRRLDDAEAKVAELEDEFERFLIALEETDKGKELRKAWWTIDKQEARVAELEALLHDGLKPAGYAWKCCGPAWMERASAALRGVKGE